MKIIDMNFDTDRNRKISGIDLGSRGFYPGSQACAKAPAPFVLISREREPRSLHSSSNVNKDSNGRGFFFA